MEYRSMGRTGVQVSKICLGCMMFGLRTEPEEAYRIIDKAIEGGINFFDTANAYSLGRSEEITGEGLKRNSKRHRIVLATKVFAPMNQDDPNARGIHRRHIIEQCEASLKRLQTDYIDLYQIHRPVASVPIDETLRALDDLVRSGKVRYIGTSTYAAWQLVESLWVAKEYGLNRFVTEQPPYNLLERRVERELLPMARTYGFAIIPWSPLAGGLLTGKYTKDGDQPENTRFTKEWNGWRAQEAFQQALKVVDQLKALAESKGCTLSQFSLAWVAQQPGITSPIIGPRTLEQLEDNLRAADLTLSEEELKKIDAIVPPGRAVFPMYNADFGPHPYRW